MPTYDYVCESCSHEFEAIQSMSADRLTTCPECEDETLRRKIGTGAGIIFKGSGFYETDYKRKSGGKSEEGGESTKSGDSKKEGGASTSSSDSGKKKAAPSSGSSTSSKKE